MARRMHLFMFLVRFSLTIDSELLPMDGEGAYRWMERGLKRGSLGAKRCCVI